MSRESRSRTWNLHIHINTLSLIPLETVYFVFAQRLSLNGTETMAVAPAWIAAGWFSGGGDTGNLDSSDGRWPPRAYYGRTTGLGSVPLDKLQAMSMQGNWQYTHSLATPHSLWHKVRTWFNSPSNLVKDTTSSCPASAPFSCGSAGISKPILCSAVDCRKHPP